MNFLKTRRSVVEEPLDSRRTLPPNNEIFKELSFSSPIGSSKVGHIEDLSRLSVYEVPKMNRRPVDLLPSYDEAMGETQAPDQENWDKLDLRRNTFMTRSMGKIVKKEKSLSPKVPTLTRNRVRPICWT